MDKIIIRTMKTKGFVFDSKGAISKQIDIIILVH